MKGSLGGERLRPETAHATPFSNNTNFLGAAESYDSPMPGRSVPIGSFAVGFRCYRTNRSIRCVSCPGFPLTCPRESNGPKSSTDSKPCWRA